MTAPILDTSAQLQLWSDMRLKAYFGFIKEVVARSRLKVLAATATTEEPSATRLQQQMCD